MIFLHKTKQSKKIYYLGLNLSTDNGSAILLAENAEATKIQPLDEKIFSYSNGWENIVDDIDEVLLELEKMNNSTASNVIFFLSSQMVTPERVIKQPYLTSIKKIAKELNLKPLGFIEQHESLALWLESKENVPLSAIVIEFGEIEASIFLYKNGEVIARETVVINNEIFDELSTLFSKFKINNILPSRILAYGENASSSFISKLLNYKFEDHLFIQFPIIKSYSHEEIKEALIYSFSEQILSTAPDVEKTETLPDGFVVDEDIKQTQETFNSNVDGFEPDKRSSGNKLSALFAPILGIFHRKPKVNAANRKFKIIYFLIPILVVFLLSLFSTLYFFHTATVIVHVPKKTIEKRANIVGKIESKANNNELAIRKVEEESEAEDTLSTTGKKTIGEKARGEVTLYNSTTNEKVFKSGTILATSTNIQFTLDTDIKVSSASQSLTNDGNLLTVTGKSKVNATAAQIGPQGNIEKDIKFKVEDFPQTSYFAQSNTKFSGGSKKDIQTVSKEDVSKLQANVIKKIKENQAKNKPSSSQPQIQQLTEVELTDENYSKELGEEATSVVLKAKGKSIFYTYDKNELIKLTKPLFKDSLPKSYSLSDSEFVFKINDAKKEEDEENVDIEVVVNAVAKQVIDNKNLVHSIKGKTVSHVDNAISQDHEVQIKSFVPFLKNRLPFFTRNIMLKVDTN